MEIGCREEETLFSPGSILETIKAGVKNKYT